MNTATSKLSSSSENYYTVTGISNNHEMMSVHQFDCKINHEKISSVGQEQSKGEDYIFRWFKFTLIPPYSIAHDKLRLVIWDTSF